MNGLALEIEALEERIAPWACCFLDVDPSHNGHGEGQGTAHDMPVAACEHENEQADPPEFSENCA